MFWYGDGPARTLESMDRRGDVLYIGSLAKTTCPGLRLVRSSATHSTVDRSRSHTIV